MIDLKARTALATDIAMVNPMRFNEAVADGFYPCAPETVRGSTRVFDVNDIVVLRTYGRLTDEGLPPRSAGPMACGLRDLLRSHPDAERVVYVQISLGSPTWLLQEHFEKSSKWTNGVRFFSKVDIVSVREFYLKQTRARIVHMLTEESKNLGRDE